MYMLRRVYVYMFRRVFTEYVYFKESTCICLGECTVYTVLVYVKESVQCTCIC